MKKFIPVLFLTAVVLLTIESCRKGPEDPFLSLKSRKARLAGTWLVKEYLENNSDSTTYDWESDPTPIGACGDLTQRWHREYVIKYSFDKDGRYERTWDTLLSQTDDFSETDDGCEDETDELYFSHALTKGTWEWTGGTGDVKNKERMTLSTGEDKYLGTTYDIIKLSSKELKIVYSATIPSYSDTLDIVLPLDSIVEKGETVVKRQFNMEKETE